MHTTTVILFNDKISITQGGAVYIESGGSGTFDSCSFEGNSANVSTDGYVGLEIECCKFVGFIFCSFGPLFLQSSYCVWFNP